MYEVSVEAEFAAAHFLRDYHGKCERLHGHNYRVEAHARGQELDGGGMLLDFGVLKGALRDVCAALDHTNLNDMDCFAQNPSAERIAKYIYEALGKALSRRSLSDASGSEHCIETTAASLLYAVDVYETPASRARYIAD